jgi:arylsulfatase A
MPHNYPHVKKHGNDDSPGQYVQNRKELTLYDMQNDPYETTNVIEQHPEIAEELLRYCQSHVKEFFSVKDRDF